MLYLKVNDGYRKIRQAACLYNIYIYIYIYIYSLFYDFSGGNNKEIGKLGDD